MPAKFKHESGNSKRTEKYVREIISFSDVIKKVTVIEGPRRCFVRAEYSYKGKEFRTIYYFNYKG